MDTAPWVPLVWQVVATRLRPEGGLPSYMFFFRGGDGGKNLGETQNQNPSCHLQHDLYPVLPPPLPRHSAAVFPHCASYHGLFFFHKSLALSPRFHSPEPSLPSALLPSHFLFQLKEQTARTEAVERQYAPVVRRLHSWAHRIAGDEAKIAKLQRKVRESEAQCSRVTKEVCGYIRRC